MPFRSEKQRKWMWANKPGMAREWTKKYSPKIAKKMQKRKKRKKRRGR